MPPKKKTAAKMAVKKVTPAAMPAKMAMKDEAPMPGCCKGKPYSECCKGDGPPCDGNCACKSGAESCGTGACGTSSCCMGLWPCHIMGLLLKASTWAKALAAAVIFWLFNWFWHGQLLMDRYIETSYLWLPESEMTTRLMYFPVYYAALGLIFTLIFIQFEEKSWVKGLKNGALIMAPVALMNILTYITQPIPTDILWLWAAGSLLQGAIAGLVLAALTRCTKTSCSI